jgi:hypothetical protein
LTPDQLFDLIHIVKQRKPFRRQSRMPSDAVLLIPEPESEGHSPIYGIKPGYYNSKQMLRLIEENKANAESLQFIADMLETGDPENDGFAEMVRKNQNDPIAIQRIVEICNE